jgi:hypothetical protein
MLKCIVDIKIKSSEIIVVTATYDKPLFIYKEEILVKDVNKNAFIDRAEKAFESYVEIDSMQTLFKENLQIEINSRIAKKEKINEDGTK